VVWWGAQVDEWSKPGCRKGGVQEGRPNESTYMFRCSMSAFFALLMSFCMTVSRVANVRSNDKEAYPQLLEAYTRNFDFNTSLAGGFPSTSVHLFRLFEKSTSWRVCAGVAFKRKAPSLGWGVMG
jgi:hypothetical protein